MEQRKNFDIGIKDDTSYIRLQDPFFLIENILIISFKNI